VRRRRAWLRRPRVNVVRDRGDGRQHRTRPRRRRCHVGHVPLLTVSKVRVQIKNRRSRASSTGAAEKVPRRRRTRPRPFTRSSHSRPQRCAASPGRAPKLRRIQPLLPQQCAASPRSARRPNRIQPLLLQQFAASPGSVQRLPRIPPLLLGRTQSPLRVVAAAEQNLFPQSCSVNLSDLSICTSWKQTEPKLAVASKACASVGRGREGLRQHRTRPRDPTRNRVEQIQVPRRAWSRCRAASTCRTRPSARRASSPRVPR
jgi:hypothetical protein